MTELTQTTDQTTAQDRLAETLAVLGYHEITEELFAAEPHMAPTLFAALVTWIRAGGGIILGNMPVMYPAWALAAKAPDRWLDNTLAGAGELLDDARVFVPAQSLAGFLEQSQRAQKAFSRVEGPFPCLHQNGVQNWSATIRDVFVTFGALDGQAGAAGWSCWLPGDSQAHAFLGPLQQLQAQVQAANRQWQRLYPGTVFEGQQRIPEENPLQDPPADRSHVDRWGRLRTPRLRITRQ